MAITSFRETDYDGCKKVLQEWLKPFSQDIDRDIKEGWKREIPEIVKLPEILRVQQRADPVGHLMGRDKTLLPFIHVTGEYRQIGDSTGKFEAFVLHKNGLPRAVIMRHELTKGDEEFIDRTRLGTVTWRQVTPDGKYLISLQNHENAERLQEWIGAMKSSVKGRRGEMTSVGFDVHRAPSGLLKETIETDKKIIMMHKHDVPVLYGLSEVLGFLAQHQPLGNKAMENAKRIHKQLLSIFAHEDVLERVARGEK